eukprot:954097-Pelagomonas_calceolata.AAC.3
MQHTHTEHSPKPSAPPTEPKLMACWSGLAHSTRSGVPSPRKSTCTVNRPLISNGSRAAYVCMYGGRVRSI